MRTIPGPGDEAPSRGGGMLFAGAARRKASRALAWIVEGSLAGCIFAVPFALGGRHPLGEALLVAFALAAAVAWGARQCLEIEATWRRTPGLGLWLAGLVVVAVQITPLPSAVTGWLQPAMRHWLPLWVGGADEKPFLGPWNTLSLTPAETRSALVVLLAYGLLFVITVQRTRSIEDLERLLRWTALAAVAMAIFGLVQYFTANGRFFWFSEQPYATTAYNVKGSFTNRNHFAHFLALGLGPLTWWLHHSGWRGASGGCSPRAAGAQAGWVGGVRWSGAGNSTAGALTLALGIVVFAALLSLSRGGILAMAVAATISGVALARGSRSRGRLLAALGGTALVLALALGVFGYDRLGQRMESLTSGSIETIDPMQARRSIWGAVLKAIPDFPVFGSGVGSHRQVYPMYFDHPQCSHEFTHAENSYLQVALETGLVGLGLVVAGLGLAASWCIRAVRAARSSRVAACAGAIAASLAASAVHALVDYVWYVPGCMATLVILAGAALRARQLAPQGPARRSIVVGRPRAAVAVAVVAVTGIWMMAAEVGAVLAEPDWCRFLCVEVASQRQSGFDDLAAPSDARPVAARIAVQREQIRLLQHVVRWQPDRGRAHLELARHYLGLFELQQLAAENAMSLASLRDAATASAFPTRAAMDEWLGRAVGEHWTALDRALEHAHAALALCPLEGEAYLFLAKLCFLEGDGARKGAYIDQALRVRPYDGGVLYEAAVEAWLAGDAPRWLDYLRRASGRGPRFQALVLSTLIAHAPTEGLEAVLEFLLTELEPDLDGIRVVEGLVSRRGTGTQLAGLRWYHAERAEEAARKSPPAQAAPLWLEAAAQWRAIEQPPCALACAQSAVDCSPDHFGARHVLAQCLMEAGQFSEAQQQLAWCRQRRPSDAALVRLSREALRGQLDKPGQAQAQRRGATR